MEISLFCNRKYVKSINVFCDLFLINPSYIMNSIIDKFNLTYREDSTVVNYISCKDMKNYITFKIFNIDSIRNSNYEMLPNQNCQINKINNEINKINNEINNRISLENKTIFMSNLQSETFMFDCIFNDITPSG